MFLKGYLSQLQRAAVEGVPVKGYFYWSLVDNFEWASGYAIRFGLYYMDHKSLKRIPKLSADYFKAVSKNNSVL
jgi:beta-glucosidase